MIRFIRYGTLVLATNSARDLPLGNHASPVAMVGEGGG
jgi:hypothetical protein